MTLPALSVTDRSALRALTLEKSAILQAGKVWFCRGRRIVTRSNFSLMGVAVVIPSNVDTICVSAADYPAVKEWLG